MNPLVHKEKIPVLSAGKDSAHCSERRNVLYSKYTTGVWAAATPINNWDGKMGPRSLSSSLAGAASRQP